MKVSIGKRLFFSHVVAILIVSGSIGTYFYINAERGIMRNLQNRLLFGASLVAQSLDARELARMRGAADATSPAYVALLARLRQFRRADRDIAYLYVMRRVGEGAEFVIDSDETDAQALPGTPYDDVIPTLMAGFYGPSVDDRIYADDWGSFLSAYAPIPSGIGDYLVGIDMRADDVYAKFHALRVSGLVSLLCAIGLAAVFSSVGTRYFHDYFSLFVQRCKSIAAGRFDERLQLHTGSELDEVVSALDEMTDGLERAERRRGEAEEALRQANLDLERKVSERTAELTRKNADLTEAMTNVKQLSGLLPICASCKKIRDDRGYWRIVEDYMQSHSDAQFSHSICPDCSREAYAELDRDA